MVDILMQECRRFHLGRLDILFDDYEFFHHDHYIVSNHKVKPDQPILIKDLELKVFKNLNNETIHNVLLAGDSPDTNCHNCWNQALYPPTFRHDINFDNNCLLKTLFEWLQRLMSSNINV